jgi:hypothetical protein
VTDHHAAGIAAAAARGDAHLRALEECASSCVALPREFANSARGSMGGGSSRSAVTGPSWPRLRRQAYS